jgi:hypothetical protein
MAVDRSLQSVFSSLYVLPSRESPNNIIPWIYLVEVTLLTLSPIDQAHKILNLGRATWDNLTQAIRVQDSGPAAPGLITTLTLLLCLGQCFLDCAVPRED